MSTEGRAARKRQDESQERRLRRVTIDRSSSGAARTEGELWRGGEGEEGRRLEAAATSTRGSRRSAETLGGQPGDGPRPGRLRGRPNDPLRDFDEGNTVIELSTTGAQDLEHPTGPHESDHRESHGLPRNLETLKGRLTGVKGPRRALRCSHYRVPAVIYLTFTGGVSRIVRSSNGYTEVGTEL
jgi:hypothetical protein